MTIMATNLSRGYYVRRSASEAERKVGAEAERRDVEGWLPAYCLHSTNQVFYYRVSHTSFRIMAWKILTTDRQKIIGHPVCSVIPMEDKGMIKSALHSKN